MRHLFASVAWAAALAAAAADYACLVPFEVCPGTGACVLDSSLCGSPCKKGEYLCPMSKTECVPVDSYTKCSTIPGSWLDPTLDVEDRLDKLVAMVSVEDQVAQMHNGAPALLSAGISSYQWLNDDEHGLRQSEGTVFPSMCTAGPTFNRTFLGLMGSAEAHEARALMNGFTTSGARGVSPRVNGIGVTAYAPMINLAWNPFWGRNQESAGEDPTVSAELAISYVDGWQSQVTGPSGRNYTLGLACAKHYAANNVESVPAPRMNYSAVMEARTSWEYHFRVFQQVVTRASPGHIMASYNSITDTNSSNTAVPTAASPELLDGLLRGLWGWPGFVVSDYDAWAFIASRHEYKGCTDSQCAATYGLNAGMDQEGGGDSAVMALPAALAAGQVTAKRIEQSFRRLFAARIRLGFHDPPADNPANRIANDTSVLQSADHLRLAREGAAQGMVLLSNRDKALPLDPTAFAGGRKLALVGFQAFDAMSILGNYDVLPRWPPGVVTIADGIGDVIGNASILRAQGCPDVTCEQQGGFDAALAAAREADAVVYTLGLTFEGGSDSRDEREGHDRTDLTLYPGAYELLTKLKQAAGDKPVIAVLVHGGPVVVGPVLAAADAVVDAHYPGMQGGAGLADVLFGAVSPAGRLTSTYYASNDALTWPGVSDDAYNFLAPGGKGATYRYLKDQSRKAIGLPFGYGLSYTTFKYGAATVSADRVGACGAVDVTVTVTNTGDVDSDEVVQLYTTLTPDGSAGRSAAALADFERVHIKAGASATVTLRVEPDDRFVVEPESYSLWAPRATVFAGEVDVFVGGGQPGWDPLGSTASFTVTATAPMHQCSGAFPPHP